MEQIMDKAEADRVAERDETHVPPHLAKPVPRRFRKRIAVAGIAVLLPILVFGPRLREAITAGLALRSDAPAHAALELRLARAPDRAAEIASLWHTQRIPHRLFALNAARDTWARDRATYAALAPVLRAAAADGDYEIKRLAVNLITAQAQADDLLLLVPLTRDADVAVRLLGLENLRRAGDERFNAVAAACLDDRDLAMRIAAATALRKWNDVGVECDVRAISPEAVVEQCTRRWTEWWRENAGRFPAVPEHGLPESGQVPALAVEVGLDDLSGTRVRVPSRDGRATVVHFWSTRNEDSVRVLRRLLELETAHDGRLRVAAVAVDAVPEFHIDGGHAHDDHHDCGPGDHAHDDTFAGRFGRRRYRASLRRFVEHNGIDGLVLIDDGSASGVYRSDELPTTVLVGANGRVHRRFSGVRTDEELAALVRELVESTVSTGG